MNELLNKAIDFLANDDFRRITLEKYYHPKTKHTTYYARLEEKRFDDTTHQTCYFLIGRVKMIIDEFTYKTACEFLKHEEYEEYDL